MAVPVLIVDDHGVIAEPLKMALGAHGFDRVSSISEDLTPESVLAAARDVEAGIVLLDLHLGDGQLGIPMIAPLAETGARVVLFTASKDPRLIAAGLRAGAEAVIDKAMAFNRLVAVLVDLSAGRELVPPEEREALIAAFEERFQAEDARRAAFASLTTREAQVLRLLIAGDAPKTIARGEGVSVSTVRGHLERIFAKLDVPGQREAIVAAREAGWPPD
ncbi:MAG: LuxR C-terminal-related transcriptional regulator [Acidimicrobiales bacterium]